MADVLEEVDGRIEGSSGWGVSMFFNGGCFC